MIIQQSTMNNSRISNDDEDEEDQVIFKKLLNIHRAREKTQSFLSKRLQQKRNLLNRKLRSRIKRIKNISFQIFRSSSK